MKRVLLGGAILLACSAAMQAAAYTVKSAVDCPDIVREDENANYREMNKWWLMGYFTGRNYAADAETGRSVEDNEIYRMALEFCRENPERDWDDAAIEIYGQLE